MVIVDTVIEYDIKSAGLSTLFEKKAISKKKFDYMFSLDKKTRVVKTGLLLRNNKRLYPILKEGIKEFVAKFIKVNKIKKTNVLEIANDAVWVLRTRATKLKFGRVINFVPKRNYTSMWKIKKGLYVYYNSITGELLSRGFHIEKDEVLSSHMKKIMKAYEFNLDTYNAVHDLKDIYLHKKAPNIIANMRNKTFFRYMITDFIER